MPMPEQPDFTTTPLAALERFIESDPLPPVERWNPAHCGTMDLRIDAAGRWYHDGVPITRPAMVRAFSRILRREADGGYVLVTPAERVAIAVEDAPLIVAEARIEGSGSEAIIMFRLTTDAMILCGPDHPLTLRDGPAGMLPYLRVSGSAERPIEARLSRPVYYQLAEAADESGAVWSGGMRFALGPE